MSRMYLAHDGLKSEFIIISMIILFFSILAGVGDAGLQELSALTSLTALNLDSRLFTDVGMRHLKPLTNLVLLDLFAAKVSDIGCGYIRYMLNLASTLPSALLLCT